MSGEPTGSGRHLRDAFDWAKDHHDVLVLDGAGKIVAVFRFDHTASGWALCQEKLAQFPAVAIAVEAGHNAAIERSVTLAYRVNALAQNHRGHDPQPDAV